MVSGSAPGSALTVVWGDLVDEAPSVTFLGAAFFVGWIAAPPHTLSWWLVIPGVIFIFGVVLWRLRSDARRKEREEEKGHHAQGEEVLELVRDLHRDRFGPGGGTADTPSPTLQTPGSAGIKGEATGGSGAVDTTSTVQQDDQ